MRAAAKVIDSVRLPYIAPSLGGVESLIEQPTVVSYWDYGPEQRAELGIRDGLIRFSVGIENYADIEEGSALRLQGLRRGRCTSTWGVCKDMSRGLSITGAWTISSPGEWAQASG